MTKSELKLRLNNGRISSQERDFLIDAILTNPSLFGILLKLVYQEDTTKNWHCSWVYDHVLRKQLSLILPHMPLFTQNLGNLQSQSVIRPMAHTCQQISLAYYKDQQKNFQQTLTTKQLKLMTEACFAWLIDRHNIAPKVYAMTSLLYLGQTFTWVHGALYEHLLQTIATASAGYKSRGKKVLYQLKQLGY